MAEVEPLSDAELEKLVQEGGEALYAVAGVTFEVVAKVKAVRDDGKVVETLVGPILLYQGNSLYRAMFEMGMACSVPEYKPDVDELGPAAEQVVAQLRGGEFSWTKAKKK
jgi:hypothetical protein